MREIEVIKIKDAVKALCLEANFNLPEDVRHALNEALAREESSNGREIIREVLKNAEIAKGEKLPICQDTGYVIVFLEIGQEVKLLGGNLRGAVNEGVSEAYNEGQLRKSIVSHPFLRKNTGDNTPAVVHMEIVPGDKVKIGVLPKGGGGENSSVLKMFDPSASKQEVLDFIVERVREVGPKSCPPLILGVGIGATFDTVASLAKKALLRRVGQHNSNPDLAKFEKEILKAVNKSGVGPMGLGGRVTALAVNLEIAPCHIASLPVAINFECHAHRYKEKSI